MKRRLLKMKHLFHFILDHKSQSRDRPQPAISPAPQRRRARGARQGPDPRAPDTLVRLYKAGLPPLGAPAGLGLVGVDQVWLQLMTSEHRLLFES